MQTNRIIFDLYLAHCRKLKSDFNLNGHVQVNFTFIEYWFSANQKEEIFQSFTIFMHTTQKYCVKNLL